jgi:hypothetical protein
MAPLKQHLNDINMIVYGENITFKDTKKIMKLITKKEKMKQDGTWQEFIEGSYSEKKIFNDLNLVECNDDLIKFLFSPKLKCWFNNLICSQSTTKKEEWAKKITKVLEDNNMYDSFLKDNHGVVERMRKEFISREPDISRVLSINNMNI